MADLMGTVLAQVMMSKSFGRVGESQRQSIIDALMLTIVPAGGAPDANREALRQQLLTLPWAWEPSASSADGLVDRSRLRMTRLEDPSLLRPFGRALARGIRDRRLRENVVRMMVLLYYADGGTTPELRTLTPLCEAMGIPAVRATAIFDQLREAMIELVG